MCWSGVLCKHFLRIKMQHWNKCLTELIFISFRSILLNPCQKDARKKLKLPKVGKGHLKPSFFLWFIYWWIHLCETDWLGVGKDIKKMSSDFNVSVTSWFLEYVHLKPYFNTQCPPPLVWTFLITWAWTKTDMFWPLLPSSCRRSYWMAPCIKLTFVPKKGIWDSF